MAKDRSHLNRKTIIDKNGHNRTVYVKNDDGSSGSRIPTTPTSSVQSAATRQAEAVAPINTALKLLRSDNWGRFPIDMQKAAVAAANVEDASDEVLAATNELAEACESWNFHYTAAQLWGAIGRAHIRDNPDDEMIHVSEMAMDENSSPELLRHIWENSERQNLGIYMSNNPNTPGDILDTIAATSEDYYVAENVAKNPSASPETLAHIAHNGTWQGKYAVAENPRTDDETFAFLEKSDHPRIKEAVASGRAKRASRA